MAGRIKGITVEIGGDVSKLDESLKKADKSISSVRSELREVEKALKLDPSNVTLLKQKHELLAEQVQKTTEKLDMLKGVQGNIEEQFKSGKINGEQYRAFQREIVNTENALKQVKKDFENAEAATSMLEGEILDVTTVVRQLTEELSESDDEIENNEEALGKLETQTKAEKTASEKLKSVVESLKEKFDKAVKVVEQFAKVAQKLAESTLKALTVSLKAVSAEVEVGMKSFQAYVAGLTTATTAIGGFAIKSGADFESSMSKVQSLSGATGDELKALEEKARQMGASTSKSAAESADALSYMALAGWNTQQMLSGLEPILRASEAGEMDLAICSDLVTDSMSAMGIQVEDLNHYLDVVTKTQSSANTSMQQMLEAYTVVGGTLRNMDVPLEESATLIGILANRSIKGSEAGTSLNSVLVNLMGSGGQAAEALESLGVSMYNIDGTRKSITTTLTELNTALSRCSNAERDVFTAHIGGKTQMDTLQALLAGLNEEYGDLYGKLNDVDGCLTSTAKAMQENFNGAVTATKSALEGLGISIYSTFNDELQQGVRSFADYVSTLSNAIEKGWSISGTLKYIFSQIRKQIGDYIVSLAQELPEMLKTYNTVIIEVIRTVAEMIPGLSAIILPKLLEGMSSLVSTLISNLPSYIRNFSTGIRTLLRGIMKLLQSSATQFTDVLPEIIQVLFSKVNVDTLKTVYQTGIQILTTLIQGVSSIIPDIIPVVLDCVDTMLSTLISTVVENLPLILDTGLKLLISLIQGILDNLPQIISAMQECVLLITDTVIENLPLILDSGMQILWAIINGIIEILPELITTAVDLLLLIVDTILDNLDEIIDAALEIVIALCEALIDNLDKIIDATQDIVVAIFMAIIDNLDKIIDAAIQILITIGVTLIDSAGRLLDYIPQLADKISNALTSYDWAGLGGRIMDSIFNGITNMASRAQEKLASAGEHILNYFGFHPDGTSDFSLPFFANGGTLTSGSAIVGEAGPELLSVANGRAVVTPLTNSSGSQAGNMVNNSPIYYITNTVHVDKISNDYDITRINERLAFEQRRQMSGVGK